MAVDRTIADDLASNLVEIYADAERRLAAGIAARLAAGIESPAWADDKLRAVGQLRRWAETVGARLAREGGAEVAQSLVLAYSRGGSAAMAELARAQSTHPEWLRLAGVTDPGPALLDAIARRQAGLAGQLRAIETALPGGHALNRLIFSLSSRLRGTHTEMIRWSVDAYRQAVAAGSAVDVLLGTSTRRQATQRAWDGLLSKGVKGFTDASGRRWNLASYVEMATRTTVAQAAVEGHLDRLGDAGLDLVIVSNAPQECERCRPWEGKILARRDGTPVGPMQVEHATSDRPIMVDVAGSVSDATRAGLMHPNCRHSINAYLPGLTTVPAHTADPEGNAARERLRELERRVRAQKLREAGALDAETAATARARAREIQGQIREHVAATEHLGIMRKPERERLNLGHVAS